MTLQYETTDATEARLHGAANRAMRDEAASIKAGLCAARGLPPSSGCQVCGATDQAHRSVCEQKNPGVCDWLPADDTEGGCAA